MKKNLLFLSAAMLSSVSVFAQDEVDMTSFMANPGFDEDITWTVSGGIKPVNHDLDYNLSDRTQVWYAEDGSAYGHSTGTRTRGDGIESTKAWNGFIGQVAGWTVETKSMKDGKFTPEWVYFGTVPYGIGEQAVPISDDGNTCLAAPETKPEGDNGDDNLAAIYLRAGWGGGCSYKQQVKLPCARYRLDYWVLNANYEGSKETSGTKNLCKVICRNDEFVDEDGFNAAEWTKHSIEFVPTTDFTIQIGYEAPNTGSAKCPYLFIDGIRLYKVGEADPIDNIINDIEGLVGQMEELMSEDPYASFEGILKEAEVACQTAQDAESDFENIEQAEAERQKLKDFYDYLLSDEFLATANEWAAAEAEAVGLMESDEEKFPTFDSFVQTANDIMDEAYAQAGAATLADYVASLKSSIDDYRMSQEASEENPADFTFYIDNPTFVAQGKWVMGPGGGDQRLNTSLTDNNGNGITVWNAWSNGLDTPDKYVSITQELTSLPNGYYKVSAELCTEPGCINDQHIFANGSAHSSVSPVMTTAQWNPYYWDKVETGKVLVVDGKLSIGAIGHGTEKVPADNGGTLTDHRCGWFCVTNFKIFYLGEATAEEYAAAIEAKFAEAEEYAAAMHFAADKAEATEAVAAAKAEADLDALKEAMAAAEASESEYNGVVTGSMKTVQEYIDNADAASVAARMAKVPVQYINDYINSAEATSKVTPSLTAITRYYRDNLIPATDEVQAAADKLSAKEGRTAMEDEALKALEGTLQSVERDLSEFTDNTDYLSEQLALLKKALDQANLACVAIEAGADMTQFITNPTCENTGVGNVPNGWTGVMSGSGNGNYANKGQEFDGNTNGYYMDAWNGTPGALKYKESQTLEVPNGTYTLTAMMRTTGAGFYLYAIGEDGVPVKVEAVGVPTPAKYLPGAEADEVRTDNYGPIWAAAADKIMAKFGVTSATPETTVCDLVIELCGGEETCPEGVDETDWNVFNTNGGQGRGWFYVSLPIQVTNHQLEIGVATGDAFEDATAFDGTWLSADNFTLTLDTPGDNSDWNPVTGIGGTKAKTEASDGPAYDLSGAEGEVGTIVIKNGVKYFNR